ncbi:MAG TPA: hypothetical protein VN345_11700 [Blastocatellia bacterium]|nr:hypothetical protein [Blastocatellia bacterium]
MPDVATIGISAPLGYNANMVYGHASVDALLKSVDEFFMGEGPVHKTMRTLARRFPEAGVDYAIVGAMALVMHGYRRETVDVDVLMSREGRDLFVENLVGRGYVPLFPGAKKQFRDTETGVEIDIITEGEYPGDGKPKPVSFPPPIDAAIEMDGIRIITLEKLVELKLASGMSAPHRLRDLADVQELIKVRGLGADFAESLDNSVRTKYLELWDSVNNVNSASEE